MSLIVTLIGEHGIVHASDSNLTANGCVPAGEGTKLFKIEGLPAALTVAGSYQVGGVRMDQWMHSFLEGTGSGQQSVSDFARTLRDQLESQMTEEEKKGGCIVHIAGYERDRAGWHPEFWFVRNVHGIDPLTGDYRDIGANFAIGEEFWSKVGGTGFLREGKYQIYANGFPPGRAVFMGLQKPIVDLLESVWFDLPQLKFRPPHTVEETGQLLKIHFAIISALFLVSDHKAPIIGGETQIHCIPPPPTL